MFCQSCGTQVQPGQQFCGKCAMPLTGYALEQKSRLRRHLHLLGIFWIAYGAFDLLGGAGTHLRNDRVDDVYGEEPAGPPRTLFQPGARHSSRGAEHVAAHRKYQ